MRAGLRILWRWGWGRERTGDLGLVRARVDDDVDLEALREGAQEAHADAQADERGHAAVRDRRREVHMHVTRRVVHGDLPCRLGVNMH